MIPSQCVLPFFRWDPSPSAQDDNVVFHSSRSFSSLIFMRIGIDARMYGYAQTGIGNYIRHLLDFIFKLDKENSYVIFLLGEEYDRFKLPEESSWSNSISQSVQDGRIKKVKVSSKWYGWKEQLLFPFDLYRERLDLMHFTHFNSPVLYFKKSIVTIHDITPYYFPGHKMKSIVRRTGFKVVFFSSVKKAKKVIAVSESTKSDIVEHFGISEDKIAVIYEGVDSQFKPSWRCQDVSLLKKECANFSAGKESKNLSYWEGRKSEIKEDISRLLERQKVIDTDKEELYLKKKYGISKPFIFYTGVWRNHKNLVGLIKAFAILKSKYRSSYQLVLGGREDPYYPEVRKTWEKFGLEKEVIRVGFINQNELPLFYRAAKVFVVPSFYEGFGLIGLESMACGTPVVSSNRTSLPEIFGNAAIYFDPENSQEMAEKINLVLSDEKLYNKLVERGFDRVKKYSWEEMARKTLEIYRKVLET